MKGNGETVPGSVRRMPENIFFRNKYLFYFEQFQIIATEMGS